MSTGVRTGQSALLQPGKRRVKVSVGRNFGPYSKHLIGGRGRAFLLPKEEPMPAHIIHEGSLTQKEVARRVNVSIPTLMVKAAKAGVTGTKLSGRYYSPAEIARIEAVIAGQSEPVSQELVF